MFTRLWVEQLRQAAQIGAGFEHGVCVLTQCTRVDAQNFGQLGAGHHCPHQKGRGMMANKTAKAAVIAQT